MSQEFDPELVPIQDAATVILVDDRPDLEVLCLRRRAGSSFVGGMTVFPGGGVDPEDHDPRYEGRTAAKCDRPARRARAVRVRIAVAGNVRRGRRPARATSRRRRSPQVTLRHASARRTLLDVLGGGPPPPARGARRRPGTAPVGRRATTPGVAQMRREHRVDDVEVSRGALSPASAMRVRGYATRETVCRSSALAGSPRSCCGSGERS
jgi:hypothetical protein